MVMTQISGRSGRPHSRRLRGPGPAYAAVDLGTNNCRLLVAEPTARGFRVVDAFSRIVRLGEGVAATGALSEEAIGRTIDALGVCASKIRRFGRVRARHVATEACRTANNCDDFLGRVESATGLTLEIIDTREEARLAVGGCVPLLDAGMPHALVVDIGGGSTEVIWLRLAANGAINGAADARVNGSADDVTVLSLPIGVVNLSERFGGDGYGDGGYEAMVEEVRDLMEPFEAENGIRDLIADGAVQMIGTSGTVTTLASVHLGLKRYVRSRVDGCTIRFDAAARISRELAAMDYASRARMGCIGPDRADLVVAGAAILEAVCRMWPVGRLRVADRGLREGILLGLMAEDGHRAARLAGEAH